jgi:hypothetical protein
VYTTTYATGGSNLTLTTITKLFCVVTGLGNIDEPVPVEDIIDGTFRDWKQSHHDRDNKMRDRARRQRRKGTSSEHLESSVKMISGPSTS